MEGVLYMSLECVIFEDKIMCPGTNKPKETRLKRPLQLTEKQLDGEFYQENGDWICRLKPLQ